MAQKSKDLDALQKLMTTSLGEDIRKMDTKYQDHRQNIFISLPNNEKFIDTIQTSKTDWEYIVRIAAALEAMSYDFLTNHLNMDIDGEFIPKGTFREKIKRVNISIVIDSFLDIIPITKPYIKYIKIIQELRNKYIHDINSMDKHLIELLNKKQIAILTEIFESDDCKINFNNTPTAVNIEIRQCIYMVFLKFSIELFKLGDYKKTNKYPAPYKR